MNPFVQHQPGSARILFVAADVVADEGLDLAMSDFMSL